MLKVIEEVIAWVIYLPALRERLFMKGQMHAVREQRLAFGLKYRGKGKGSWQTD